MKSFWIYNKVSDEWSELIVSESVICFDEDHIYSIFSTVKKCGMSRIIIIEKSFHLFPFLCIYSIANSVFLCALTFLIQLILIKLLKRTSCVNISPRRCQEHWKCLMDSRVIWNTWHLFYECIFFHCIYQPSRLFLLVRLDNGNR